MGLCIRTGDIVWINGPFPCGRYPESRYHYFSARLDDGEKVEAVKGYRGEGQYVNTPAEGSHIQARVRARHETVNKRLKQWSCLSRSFRHEGERHQVVFGAVAGITQLALENEEHLYDVNEYCD